MKSSLYSLLFIVPLGVIAFLGNLHGQLVDRSSRVFTSSDGRQIKASVDNYNPSNSMASLRMTSTGKVYDIPIDRFIEEDQAYLIQWRSDYEQSFIRVNFFTHRIDSGRVIFMLDRSGSMNGDRWDKMIRNMSELIDRLDPNTDFNIILFGSGADFFKKDLVTAGDAIKEEAKLWLAQNRPGGGTNLYAAVQLASSMKKAVVYAILSDGYPSGTPDAIFDQIRKSMAENETDIRVFAVSYQSTSEGVDFMKDLAAGFNGAHVKR